MTIWKGTRKMSDFKNLWNDPDFMSDEQRAEINLEVDLILKLIEAREEKGMTQAKLAEITGLKQSAVARLESMRTKPQIGTIIKVLKPLGYKLAIIPDVQTEMPHQPKV